MREKPQVKDWSWTWGNTPGSTLLPDWQCPRGVEDPYFDLRVLPFDERAAIRAFEVRGRFWCFDSFWTVLVLDVSTK